MRKLSAILPAWLRGMDARMRRVILHSVAYRDVSALSVSALRAYPAWHGRLPHCGKVTAAKMTRLFPNAPP